VDLDWGQVLDRGEIDGLGHNEFGQVIVNPYGDAYVVDDDAPGRRSRTVADSTDPEQLGGHSITAANGVSVEVLPVDGRFDPEGGYLISVSEPAKLQVTNADGEVDWTVTAGGVGAPWLDLIDFDGRHVMLSRAPGEPADPVIQHIVYDLDCRRPATEGCSETFWARPGTASLVGPDREPGDDSLSLQSLDICPTMGRGAAAPVEMIASEGFDETFTALQRQAFELAAVGLSLCDVWTLGLFDAEGLDFDPGTGDDGWLWTEFALAMEAPPRFVEGEGWVWSTHPERASVIIRDEFAQPWVEFRPPPRRLPGRIAMVVTPDVVLLDGTTDQAFADELRGAGAVLADSRGIELVDRLAVAGPPPSQEVRDELLDSVANGFPPSVAAGETHLTDDGVVVSTVPSTGPSRAERALGFAIADFASGGEGVFDELPLTGEIALALGSEVRAVRTVLELSRRGGWAVDAYEFRGSAGPFNLLDLVPSPSEVTLGPLGECGFPIPTPAPPSLAAYRRINVLPAEGSVDSCPAWSAVSLYVDDGGLIRGIGLDKGEP
ncbi:MAG: hypothetical protein OER95_06065, partial [Acidimicrobiia bacterium]|nr:hypothetical protein [Acidimicrobiia bacterium]